MILNLLLSSTLLLTSPTTRKEEFATPLSPEVLTEIKTDLRKKRTLSSKHIKEDTPPPLENATRTPQLPFLTHLRFSYDVAPSWATMQVGTEIPFDIFVQAKSS